MDNSVTNIWCILVSIFRRCLLYSVLTMKIIVIDTITRKIERSKQHLLYGNKEFQLSFFTPKIDFCYNRQRAVNTRCITFYYWREKNNIQNNKHYLSSKKRGSKRPKFIKCSTPFYAQLHRWNHTTFLVTALKYISFAHNCAWKCKADIISLNKEITFESMCTE